MCRSTEFSEPPERLALFSKLRATQVSAHRDVVDHIERMPGLMPPQHKPSKRRVAGWVDDAARLASAWEDQLPVWKDR